MRLHKALLISEEPGVCFVFRVPHELCTSVDDSNRQMNNTLKDNQCPAHSGQLSGEAQAIWLSIFAPNITQRLNSDAPGSTLVDADIPMLMSLCSFESLSHRKTSSWCGVFTQEDWEAYEYYTDLEKFYNTG